MAEFKESEHPRDKDGKFTDKAATQKAIIHRLRERHAARKRKASGAISGALNSDSDEAKEHAKKYYEFLKNTKSDVSKISHNTGIKEETIQKIKNYLFIDSHDLLDGYHPFHPDYDIAVSWQRLTEGKDIKEMDLILLNHEMEEMKLREAGYPQQFAHEMANKKFNYQKMVVAEKKNGSNKKH